MKEDLKKKFAKRIRDLRQEYGYSQEELSEFSGIDYKHIQKLEGKNSCDVKLSTLNKIAQAFKISVSELLKM